MSFRRTLGNIIMFFAVLGLIINVGIFATSGFLLVNPESVQMLETAGLEIDILSGLIGSPIGIVVNLFWLGIGFLIRGRNETTQNNIVRI